MAIRTAIIGFGTAGRIFHAPFLAADPAFRIDAIVTGNAERAAEAQREHPQARILPDVDALWSVADAIDLVVVASPSGLHRAHADAALRAGCHVVVDKPFVAAPAEGDDLIALARAQERMLTVFQNRRWDGDFRTVQQLVAAGRLGEVCRFESRFTWWKPTISKGWKAAATVADAGGILYDLGPHLIDQAVQLFGPARVTYAEVDTVRPDVVADDDVFVALEHDSGVRSHLWMSAVSPTSGPRFRVLGSEAAYTTWGLDGQEPALIAGSRPGDPGFGDTPADRWGTLGLGDALDTVPTEKGDYGLFYTGVAEAILEGAPAPVDPADAVAGLRLIAQAHAFADARRGGASDTPTPDAAQ